jgi:glycosyltransferase involved in cell wall biosynthesis
VNVAPDQENTSPAVSAALCTHDRPGQLRRALQSLCDQTRGPDEVLVIDSCPTGSSTREMIVAEFPGVRYCLEDRPGVGFARDRALREARHPIVAFLDDDAVAGPDWIAATRAAMSGPDRPAACTGRVEALETGTAAQQLFEANGGFDRGTRRIVVSGRGGTLLGPIRAPLVASAVSIGSACSMALDRASALAAGGFDGAFGSTRQLTGGEDLDLLWRLVSAGKVVTYEPSVRARHEHRATMDELATQLAGHQRNLLAMLWKAATCAPSWRRPGTWLFFAWRLVKPGYRLARRVLRRDPLPVPVLLRMWRGAAGGPWTYVRARQALRGAAMDGAAVAATRLGRS